MNRNFVFILAFLVSYLRNCANSIDMSFLSEFDQDPSPKSLPQSHMNIYEKNIEKYNQFKEKPLEDQFEAVSRKIYKKFRDSFVKAYSERLEELSLIQIPEWKLILDEKIIKYKKEDGYLVRKYGHGNVKNCNITEFHLKKYERLSVCPSHHVLRVRKNKYPYMRVNTECNCEKCMFFQSENLSEKKYNFLCQQEFTLMPALEKVDYIFEKYNESRWIFGMEEVATSCVCMRKLL